MTARGVGLVTLWCVAIALVAFSLLYEGAPDSAPGGNAVPVEESPTPAPVDAAGLDSLSPGRAPVLVDVQEDPIAELPAEVPEGHIRIQGAVVVVDGEGIEHPREDGEMSLGVLRADRRAGTMVDVSVAGGSFTVDVPVEHRVSVVAAVLGGRPARPARADYEPIPVEERMVMRLGWAATVVLRVVDAATGLDLDGITCVVTESWGRAHPGTYALEDRRVANGRSPLELSLDDEEGNAGWQEELCVRATGYAWERVKIDYARSSHLRVELRPAGGLDVSIVGELPAPRRVHGAIRVRDDDHLPALRLRRTRPPISDADLEAQLDQVMEALAKMSDEQLRGQPRPTRAHMREMIVHSLLEDDGGELVVDTAIRTPRSVSLAGILPGEYSVSVELGNSWGTPLVLGEATVQVDAGVRSQVTLYLKPPPERAPVPLAGTLVLPEAWVEPGLTLWFEPIEMPGASSADRRQVRLSEMQPDAAVSGLYRWKVPPVVPGRYKVSSFGLPVAWVVDTGPHGNEAAEIEVGEPVDVSLRVVESRSGHPVEGVEVHWHGVRPDGVLGGSLDRAEWDPERTVYAFRAPAGHVKVRIPMPQYTVEPPGIFDVQAGVADLLVRVRRHTGVVLFLEHEGEAVPWDDFNWPVGVFSGDQPVAGVRGQTAKDGSYAQVSEPGTYRIEIPEQPGYEPVPPFELDVPAETMVEHTVQLRAVR